MRIFGWKKSELTVKEPTYKIGSPCSCGCSPNPYLYIFDGENGVTIDFQNAKELKAFKQEIKSWQGTKQT